MSDNTNIQEPISVEAIKSFPAEELGKPDSNRAARESELFAHKERNFQNELGLIGSILGGRREKSGNIAAITILVCLFFLIAAFTYDIYGFNGSMGVSELFGVIGSIITLALGYLFGSNDSNQE